jgi:hypothetical protein
MVLPKPSTDFVIVAADEPNELDVVTEFAV